MTLTPVDQAVVVLLKCLGGVAAALEQHVRNALGLASLIEMEVNVVQGADRGCKQLLSAGQAGRSKREGGIP